MVPSARVDYYPLVVMMIEARDLVNDREKRYFMSLVTALVRVFIYRNTQ